MKKIFAWIFILTLAISSVSALKSKDIYVGSINTVDDQSYTGDYLPVSTAFKIKTKEKVNNMRVTVMIPELDARRSLGPFDVKKTGTQTKSLALMVPDDAPKGEYLARITITDKNGHKRVKHRWIELT